MAQLFFFPAARRPPRGLRSSLAIAALTLGLWPGPWAGGQALAAQSATARPQPSSAAAPTSAAAQGGLAAARASLASTPPPELAAKLKELAASLPPADALALIQEAADRLPSAPTRSAFLEQAGALALLLGRFSEAAELYQRQSAQSPTGDTEALLRAARCELAAGEDDQARDLASRVLISAKDPQTATRARLVGAWALYFSGRAGDAKTLAGDLALSAPGAPERREARFLAWASSSGPERSAAALRLAKDYPDSPEALIAAGTLQPAPLPHWYLGSVRPEELVPVAPASAGAEPAPAASVVPSAAPAAPAPGATPGTADEGAAASTTRLQVGYFSVESNARGLVAELKAKGFAAGVEQKAATSSSTSGPRWVVYVEGGADPEAMKLKLKDAGYESYPMDE